MEHILDYKIFIWVVVLIVYAIKQFKKLTSIKSTQKEVLAPAAPYTPMDQVNVPKKKPVQNRVLEFPKDKKEEAWSKPKAAKKFLKEELSSKNKSLEIIDYDDNIVSELSLASQVQKEMQAKAQRQKLSDPSLRDEHFEPYALQHTQAMVIGEKLKSPQSLREAIVLAEILDRKY